MALVFYYKDMLEKVKKGVPNPEDSESGNEVNDRLKGTFWCSCERCEIMPT